MQNAGIYSRGVIWLKGVSVQGMSSSQSTGTRGVSSSQSSSPSSSQAHPPQLDFHVGSRWRIIGSTWRDTTITLYLQKDGWDDLIMAVRLVMAYYPGQAPWYWG